MFIIKPGRPMLWHIFGTQIINGDDKAQHQTWHAEGVNTALTKLVTLTQLFSTLEATKKDSNINGTLDLY